MGEKRQKEASERHPHWKRVRRSLARSEKEAKPVSASPFHSLGRPAGGSDGQLNVIHPSIRPYMRSVFIVFYCRRRPVGFGRSAASLIIYALSLLKQFWSMNEQWMGGMLLVRQAGAFLSLQGRRRAALIRGAPMVTLHDRPFRN